MPRGAGAGQGSAAAVPVEVTPVVRRAISSYIETNGALEAENEVDIVARTSGPIVELAVEEGDLVREGQTLARLDDREARARLEISRVTLNETRLAFERAQNLQDETLISPEEYERAKSAFESARAQVEQDEIQLDYTHITAPFGGLIVTRYIKFADQIASNEPLFRVSDFDPLLCPIQVPERELSKLRQGQRAYLTVEPWPGERFEARVLRISPVVDAGTGTIKVTLETRPQGKLRPGMFSRVFVETDTRNDALVIPKAALSLESIGDTVYVVDGDVASRREIELGFAEGDFVEARSGIDEGERVVVVGQDGLSDGTPIQVLRKGEAAPAPPARTAQAGDGRPQGGPPGDMRGKGKGGRRFDPSQMTPEQLERVKENMRARGMTEEQIEERLKGAREQSRSQAQ
jgi:membrane fusion protein (multidrug efflux system)